MDKKFIISIILCVLFAASVTFAHELHEDETGQSADHQAQNQHINPFAPENDSTSNIAPGEVGITENLGKAIPLDVQFADENGKPVDLKNFIDRPTLILPVFFHCPQECSILLANLASALNDVSFKPGVEYRVLAVSFDSEETPHDALLAKKDYLKLLKRDFPENDWKFMTGNPQSIQDMTRAIGFLFKKLDTHNFVHPNVLICVAKGGKIIRYLYGPYFLPFDVSMAISEAVKGTPGISVKKLVSYCFAYDPVGKKYVFKSIQITGVAILGFLAIFLFFLLRKKKEPDERDE
jgi:protein SCO1